MRERKTLSTPTITTGEGCAGARAVDEGDGSGGRGGQGSQSKGGFAHNAHDAHDAYDYDLGDDDDGSRASV